MFTKKEFKMELKRNYQSMRLLRLKFVRNIKSDRIFIGKDLFNSKKLTIGRIATNLSLFLYFT